MGKFFSRLQATLSRVLDSGNGKFITITPPVIQERGTTFISFEESLEKKSRIKVNTRPENLKLYWPMEEISGFTIKDSVGNANGSLAGRTSRVEGKIGQAIEFDGVSGYAWTEPLAEKLGISGKNSRTISFWIWLNAYQPNEKAGAYGYGHLSNYDGTDRFWESEILLMAVLVPLLDHYGWSFSLAHDLELRSTWNHFAHTFDGLMFLFSLMESTQGLKADPPLILGMWNL